jgi:hypothetical protein
MGRSLVLVRAGSRSLHSGWTEPGKPRDWDLYVSPFEEIPAQEHADWTAGDLIPGMKWTGLWQLLNEWDGWREYDYVWLPDDDIAAEQNTISRMFEIARGVGLDLFAPALDESSYYAHFITMRNRSFHGRWTGFVEIMAPCFSAAALEKLLPTFELSRTGSGWGLDVLWPKLLDYRNVGIVDATPVVHTRPVGQMRDTELQARVMAEADAILAANDCRPMHTTHAAFGADLQRLEMSSARFFAELVKGYDYLIERDPRVLSWLVDFQAPYLPALEYPQEGTPEVVQP